MLGTIRLIWADGTTFDRRIGQSLRGPDGRGDRPIGYKIILDVNPSISEGYTQERIDKLCKWLEMANHACTG